MNKEINIRVIRGPGDLALDKVKMLFEEMYDYMLDHGLMIKLAEYGAEKWLNGILKGLGRFGILCVAESENEVIGFSYGSIRIMPDYIGSMKTGIITHVFVSSKHRETGIGKKLVQALETWFDEKEVHSIELQVLTENVSAIDFWDKLGYSAELLQCRKIRKSGL